MALTESKVVNSVEIMPETNVIQVRWKNQILRDGVEISYTFERKAYSVDQKAEFLAEVEGAEAYVTAMGW